MTKQQFERAVEIQNLLKNLNSEGDKVSKLIDRIHDKDMVRTIFTAESSNNISVYGPISVCIHQTCLPVEDNFTYKWLRDTQKAISNRIADLEAEFEQLGKPEQDNNQGPVTEGE